MVELPDVVISCPKHGPVPYTLVERESVGRYVISFAACQKCEGAAN